MAMERARARFDILVAQGLADVGDRDRVLARISTESDMACAVAGAGFVIEAAVEDIAIKQDVLQRAEQHAPDDAVTSSTTSALSATEIQSA